MINLARSHTMEAVLWRLALVAGVAAGLFAMFCIYAYGKLTVVRPLLVFLRVDGEAPPVCGLCVLFGT